MVSVGYLAVITNEEARKNEKRKDYFCSKKKVNYTPDIVGKLKLIQDDSDVKFYQYFIQDEFRLYKENEKEKSLTNLEKNTSQDIEKLSNYFAKKVVGDNEQQLLGVFNALRRGHKN
ncbi:23615_t:CDS:2 [Racocetra persica]|uniref:23615_t:CDS:1 n=1 Tax=Racocetra persica TaxID=160502 RepID=A0ACA9LWZ9_9GLOM|nr:23615_t:CDS:2 [Racocetra persica]